MMRCFFSGVTEGCQEKRPASQQSKEGRIRKSPSGDLDNAASEITGEIVAAVETWTMPAREMTVVAAVETWTTPAMNPDIQGSNTRNRGASSERRSSPNWVK